MCIHSAHKILTDQSKKIHQTIPQIPMQTAVLRLQKEAPWTDPFHISLSSVLPYIPLQLSSHSVPTNFGSNCSCQQNSRDSDRAPMDPEAIGGPPDVENNEICCEFSRTGFSSSGRRQYSGRSGNNLQ